MTVVLLSWLALFGVWPLADPGHSDLLNPLVWLDLILHVAGVIGLGLWCAWAWR